MNVALDAAAPQHECEFAALENVHEIKKACSVADHVGEKMSCVLRPVAEEVARGMAIAQDRPFYLPDIGALARFHGAADICELQ
jgi:hypothetical protein